MNFRLFTIFYILVFSSAVLAKEKKCLNYDGWWTNEGKPVEEGGVIISKSTCNSLVLFGYDADEDDYLEFNKPWKCSRSYSCKNCCVRAIKRSNGDIEINRVEVRSLDYVFIQNYVITKDMSMSYEHFHNEIGKKQARWNTSYKIWKESKFGYKKWVEK